MVRNGWLVRISIAGLLALLLVLLAPAVFGQETTAGLQGMVKDPSGGVIVKAAVEVASPALMGTKKAETDSGGYYRFANLPPGAYTVTVMAPGFRTFKQENISLATGHLPSVDVTMEVGTTTETVEVSAQAAVIDVSQSKVQTNISDTLLKDLPTQSRSFLSVIQLAPGARNEPLQGGSNGFQIDGASNSENSYLVEGQETASVFDGHAAANVPMDFIQEVQVKSSGFEAEYGGALGGVVNVIQKRGSNEWHGSVFTYYAGSKFNAAPNPTPIRDPRVAASSSARLDQPVLDYQPIKDTYRTVTPGFSLGGALVKNRLWIFLGAAPEFAPLTRSVNFNVASGVGQTPFAGNRDFHQSTNTYYTNGRVDFMATQKVRLSASWTDSYQRISGSSLPQADDAFVPQGGEVPSSLRVNGNSTTNPDIWNAGIGSVAPNRIYNVGADITLTPTLVATTRYGYFFQDFQNRGLPVGIQYTYRDTNYPYAAGNAPAGATTKALDGTTLPSQFVNSAGWTNIGGNSATIFDQWKRYSFSQDLAYFKRAAGTHNFKFGYSFNHGTNDVLNGYNTADVYVAYNVQYAPQTTNGQARCKAIIAQNTTSYGVAGGSADGSQCQGLWGTVNLRELGTTGKVGGWNHALYAQDAWTLGNGLTLNLGIRMDKENLPSYNNTPGFNGISFGWGDKIAPRLGASYDVGRKGKLKIFGSYGAFYDIMKYSLPRGSFGGDYWHDCVYALDAANFNAIIPQRDSQGHYCPLGGGATPAVGTLPNMRFIENYDYREPANDPAQAGSLGGTGLIDPALKPMRQHEMVFGADWLISPSTMFETRYSRKRLDRTIEDAGTITQDGEVYYITNPGFGVNTTVPNCTACPQNPKAYRNYDGIEFRVTRKMTHNFSGSLSYTYSRLYGNYSGLTATDVSDGGAARNGANADRAFDEAFMSYDAHGNAITANGPLPTDRPNTVKAYGYYNLKWWKFNTIFGIFQQVYSGTPLSSYISVWGAPVFLEGRGGYVDMTRAANGDWTQGLVSQKRTPMYKQTDFNIAQDFHVSATNERLVARIGVEVNNILNQHSATFIDQNLIRTGSITMDTCGTAGTNCSPAQVASAGFDYAPMMTKGYDYTAIANSGSKILNSRYGQAYGWQARRSVRFTLNITF